MVNTQLAIYLSIAYSQKYNKIYAYHTFNFGKKYSVHKTLKKKVKDKDFNRVAMTVCLSVCLTEVVETSSQRMLY